MARHARGQRACLARQRRLNPTFNLFHIFHTDNKCLPGTLQDPAIKELIRSRNKYSIYDLCHHCGKSQLNAHRGNLELFQQFIYEEEEYHMHQDDYHPLHLSRYDKLRANDTHVNICSHPTLQKVRILSNNHIETKIRGFIDLLEGEIENRGITLGTGRNTKLIDFLARSLAAEEKREFLGSLGNERRGQYGLKLHTRSRNALLTILTQDE